MKPLMKMAGVLALAYGSTALGQDTTAVEWGTKPVVRSLRAGQRPRTPATISQEAFARWDAAQTKPAVRPLVEERARRARSVGIAAEPSKALARCMGSKPVTWASSGCGAESAEEGAASTRP